MAVVDGGGYFEIVVEVLRHITFADTTFEIGVKGMESLTVMLKKQ